MKNDNEKKKENLHSLRRMRNLGWALTAMGGGVIELPGPDLLERIAVYTIVLGTVVSVGSQALLNEMDGGDGDFGSSGGGLFGEFITMKNNKIKGS